MPNPHNLMVGQAIYVTSYSGRPGDPLKELKIEKIGRFWATCGRERIDLRTLAVDNGGYGGTQTAYLTKADHADHERRTTLLNRLHSWARQYRDNGDKKLTIAEIEQVLTLVGIDFSDVPAGGPSTAG